MTNVSLSKKAEVLRVSLAKKDILKAPVLRVGAAFDESTSMKDDIKNGNLQKAFNQTMGVSITFDDNGELDCLAFNHLCRQIGVATPANHETFVSRNLKAGGSTCYAPIIDETVKMFFEPRPAGGFLGRLLGRTTTDQSPALMMVLTDGANDRDDNRALDVALAYAQKYPLFFQFVGVGGTKEKFPTIQRLAKTFPNVGEVYLPRFDMTDAEIYEQLVTDRLVAWLKQF